MGIVRVKESFELFEVVTPYGVYANMLIAKAETEGSATIGDGAIFDLTLKQLIISAKDSPLASAISGPAVDRLVTPTRSRTSRTPTQLSTEEIRDRLLTV